MSKEYPYYVIEQRENKGAEWTIWGPRFYVTLEEALDETYSAYQYGAMGRFSTMERRGLARIVRCRVEIEPKESEEK